MVSNLLTKHEIVSDSEKEVVYSIEKVGLFIFAGSVTIIIGWKLFKKKMIMNCFYLNEREIYGAITGASIFCLSFWFGPQMDYKWVFLLLCLPGILLLRSKNLFMNKLINLWIYSALVYALWTFFSNEVSLRNAVWKAVVGWVLFGANVGLLTMLGISRWFMEKTMIQER